MHAYIHIPFCRQKCPYCKFALTPIFDAHKKRRYIRFLIHEIENFFLQHPKITPSTLYFGGGTPSALTLEEVSSILSAFPDTKNIREISFECNSEDIFPEYVQELFSLGINRISLGVQSLEDATLKEVHRSDATSIISALEHICSEKNATPNPENISINIDMILGLPYTPYGHTHESILLLLRKFPAITHTSIYMLEDDIYPSHWKQISLDEQSIQQEFLTIRETLMAHGWHHYELSNFSSPGYECLHNQAYWTHRPYRGFGLSASSFFAGTRWMNAPSFAGYYRHERIQEEIITPYEAQIEDLLFGLRTNGARISPIICTKKLHSLEQDGLIYIQNDTIFPTKTGIFLIDHIISELLL